jgi:hypothetical protein
MLDVVVDAAFTAQALPSIIKEQSKLYSLESFFWSFVKHSVAPEQFEKAFLPTGS